MAGSGEEAGALGLRANRRTRTSGSLRMCRMCWKPISIERRYVEVVPPHVYFRCPSCGQSFPIRRSDVPADDAVPAGERDAIAAGGGAAPKKASPEEGPSSGQILAALETDLIDRLDLDAVRALLGQLDALHSAHGTTAQSRTLHRALHDRERILIVLEDLAQAAVGSDPAGGSSLN